MQKLVSVGMPTFSRPQLLEMALQDILLQNYENLEVIISDNCSPGVETEELVRTLMKSDSRIKYYKQPTPISAWENFEFVFRQSSGEYFMWASDDDRWDVKFISEMLSVLESDNDCVLSFSEPIMIDLAGKASEKYLVSSINTHGLGKIKSLHRVLVNQVYNNEQYGIFRKKCLEEFAFPQFFGSDHLLVAYVSTIGCIKKGPPKLMSLRMGGNGGTNEGIIRAFRIKNSVSNRYFGYIVQGIEIIKFFNRSDILNRWQKITLILIILERLFLNKVYLHAIKRDFFRFSRDILRVD